MKLMDILKEIQGLDDDPEYQKYLAAMEKFKSKQAVKTASLKQRLSDFKKISESDIKEFVDFVGIDYEENSYDGDPIESAIEHLTDIVSKCKDFSDPVRLYRIVYVEDPSSIDKTKPGMHWVSDEDLVNDWDFEFSVGTVEDDNGDPYIIEALVPLSIIDVWKTLIQNLNYPNEFEITLKNSGRGANVQRIYLRP